jgi:hypothetical protein
MKTLRAADSADAIVDGLRWRRAEVYLRQPYRHWRHRRTCRARGAACMR